MIICFNLRALIEVSIERWNSSGYYTNTSYYWVAHIKRPQFSALEKTHVVSLGRIALAILDRTLSVL